MEGKKEDIIMPWGKFKGKSLYFLPSWYVKYLAENCDNNKKIQLAADEEWQWREKYNEHMED